ncbi:hypothetical protein APA_2308 [Pseudanabaena sp. lw0831]|nr:hypothetical protein APA_2308 [Pseudanabaena sp. lw0831]
MSQATFNKIAFKAFNDYSSENPKVDFEASPPTANLPQNRLL